MIRTFILVSLFYISGLVAAQTAVEHAFPQPSPDTINQPRLIPSISSGGSLSIDVELAGDKPLFLLQSTDLQLWLPVDFGIPSNGQLTFVVGRQPENTPLFFQTRTLDVIGPPGDPISAPLTVESLTSKDSVYTVQQARSAMVFSLAFPTTESYHLLNGGIFESGNVSNLHRIENSWLFKVTPAAGQEDARAGVVELAFRGFWLFTPFGSERRETDSGTFTIHTNTGALGTDLTGRVLEFAYGQVVGDRCSFKSATRLNWDHFNNAEGTYVFDPMTGYIKIEVPITNDLFEFTAFLTPIGFSGGSTTLIVDLRNSDPSYNDPVTWTLSSPKR